MITRIEIDGFKTFNHFKIELSPLVIIAGANGSGKSK
jgi:AAA15 family ATPase/GTPase